MPSVIVRKFEQMFRVSGSTPGGAVLGTAPTDMEKMEWLYGALTILDTKAGALLAFDGLLLAAEAFMYGTSDKIAWLHPYSLGLILITLAAALLCLFVAHVSYAFLGKIVLGTYDNTAEIEKLGSLVKWRTIRLWWAWWLSVIAVVCFFAVICFVLKG